MNDGDATLIDIPISTLLLRSLQTQQEFPVKGELTVGRSKNSDIHLDDVSISRQHARVTAIAGSVIVEDLNSTNGTSVNGKKISAPQQLNVGDELRFHKYEFQLANFVEEEATMLDAVHATSALPASETDSQSDRQPDPQPESDVEFDSEPGFQFKSGAEEEATVAKPAAFVAVKAAGDISVEEALQPGPDRTQTISPQKLKLLAQRAALVKSPISAGSGARLVILTAPLRGKVFSLPENLSPGTQVNIGRGGHSNKLNIMLEDKTVSQDHAKLELTSQGWAILASNARNAITVNGESTTRSAIQHQDTITIGRMELAFLTDEQDEPRTPGEASKAQPLKKKSKARQVARVLVFMTLLAALIVAALFALPIQ